MNSILSDIGSETFNALLYAVGPVLSVFIEWDVGAFCTTVGCSFAPSSLLTVSVTKQESKSIDYLCKDMVEAVRSDLSSFSPCLKVHSFFLF